jgi:hypothetical protein
LGECFDQLVWLLGDSGTGAEQAPNGARYRLPKSLSNFEQTKCNTRGHTGLKNGVGPLDPLRVTSVFGKAIEELSANVGCPKIELAGLYGAKQAVALNKTTIVCGASHAKRMVESFCESGQKAILVETPHF